MSRENQPTCDVCGDPAVTWVRFIGQASEWAYCRWHSRTKRYPHNLPWAADQVGEVRHAR